MRVEEHPDRAFYAARHLRPPPREWWPESVEEWRKLVRELAADPAHLPIHLGGGHHVRGVPELQLQGPDAHDQHTDGQDGQAGQDGHDAQSQNSDGGQNRNPDHRPNLPLSPNRLTPIPPQREVIRTGQCRRLLNLDRNSGLVRAEAGMTWGQLHQTLHEDGFGLSPYALYPRTATLGGLLSQRFGAPKVLHAGDIRDGCVAIKALAPGLPAETYDYLPAPRKASGPDLRYLFIGAEGLLGSILDVTLVVWPRSAQRLYQIETEHGRECLQALQKVFQIGTRVAWCSGSLADRRLQLCCFGTSSYLDAVDQSMKQLFGEDCTWIEGAEVDTRRTVLEEGEMFSRAHHDAAMRSEIGWTLFGALEAIDQVMDAADEVLVTAASPHHVVMQIRWRETTEVEALLPRIPGVLWVHHALHHAFAQPPKESGDQARAGLVKPSWFETLRAELCTPVTERDAPQPAPHTKRA